MRRKGEGEHQLIIGAAIFLGFLGFMAGSSNLTSNPAGANTVSGDFKSPGQFSSCQNNQTLRCAFDMTGNFQSLIVGGGAAGGIMGVIFVGLSLGVVFVLARLASNLIPFT